MQMFEREGEDKRRFRFSRNLRTKRRRTSGYGGIAFIPQNALRPSCFFGETAPSKTAMQKSEGQRKGSGSSRGVTISANSLEESKRRARSQYDNIPDLNQQYISELGWAERKYGPKRIKKNIGKEAQKSILRPDGPSRPQRTGAQAAAGADTDADTGDAESDLRPYKKIRNKLIGDTLFAGAVGLCAAWGVGSVKDVQSFGVGLLGSVAYVFLLSRSVDRLAEGAKGGGLGGDALQPGRIGILVFLVLASAKNPDRVSILPVLFGFFMYKVASLVPLLTGEAFD